MRLNGKWLVLILFYSNWALKALKRVKQSHVCAVAEKKKRKNIYTIERWKVASVTLQQVVYSVFDVSRVAVFTNQSGCSLHQSLSRFIINLAVFTHALQAWTFSDVTLLNCTWEHEWVLSNLVPACSAQVPPPIKMQFKSCKSVKGQHLDLVVEKYSLYITSQRLQFDRGHLFFAQYE